MIILRINHETKAERNKARKISSLISYTRKHSAGARDSKTEKKSTQKGSKLRDNRIPHRALTNSLLSD